MTINVDDIFPENNFFQMTESGPQIIKSSELFGDKIGVVSWCAWSIYSDLQ